MVRDFSYIFLGVLPGCSMTVMLVTPELVGYAKQQLGELEDKSLPDLVHSKGISLCVCVEER